MSETSQTAKTDIANMALDLLNCDPMANIDDARGPVEKRVARLYDKARDLVLSLHWWTPARSTVAAAALEENDDQYSTVIQLPADCLIVWTAAGDAKGWTIRSGQGAGRLACNFIAPVKIVYGKRLTPAETPVELQLLIAAELALMASRGSGIEISARDMKILKDLRIEREDTALDICGSEGGEEQPFRSRFVDALYGC